MRFASLGSGSKGNATLINKRKTHLLLDNGFSVKETAEILEVSENTVKVNLYRARKINKDHFMGRCSLIEPGSVCSCRSFAKYMIQTNRLGEFPDILAIRKKEKASSEEFVNEITELAQIAELYNTIIKPKDYSEFINQIKKIVKNRKFKILEYE